MRNTFRISFLLTLLALVTFSTQKTQAQVLPQFGIKGGLNYSTFNNVDGVEYKPGLLVGAFVDFNIPATPMSIQPEILYSQYGANIEDSDASFNVNYLQVPVLIKFGFPTPGVKPNVYFGPYMGFNIKSEIKNDDASLNLDDQTEDTDFGVIVGAGVDVSKFRVGLRYTAGLTAAAKENFSEDAKNGGIALTLGIAF